MNFFFIFLSCVNAIQAFESVNHLALRLFTHCTLRNDCTRIFEPLKKCDCDVKKKCKTLSTKNWMFYPYYTERLNYPSYFNRILLTVDVLLTTKGD